MSLCPPIDGNDVRLLRDGTEAFPVMLEAIGSAQHEVLLEMYWFGADDIGLQFAAALRDAAARGVAVHVMYDGLGSLGADPALWETLLEGGVSICEYGTPRPWAKRFRWRALNIRNHRKNLVVDRKVAVVGGINLSMEWNAVDQGGEGWRDDSLYVCGPAVASVREVFVDTWRAEGGDHALRSQGAARRGTESRVQVLVQCVRRNRREIRKAYMARLRQAKRRILIANAYFVPDRAIRSSLARAVERGVDVRVMVPAHSDVWLVHFAARATFRRLLADGVRLLEWTPSMLHSKTTVIDDWGTVGSSNLDHRSFHLSMELNLSIADRCISNVIAESFQRDVEHCSELTLQAHLERPWVQRLLERLCYSARAWL